VRRNHESKKDRTGIDYSVGRVFWHKNYKYKGVIFGWDRQCERSDDWIRMHKIHKLPSGRSQPFYHVLPDQRYLGTPGESRYVAQDNIAELPSDVDHEVQHAMIPQFFSKFDKASGTYIPWVELMYQYPDDYPAVEEAQSAADSLTSPADDEGNCSGDEDAR
jgi:F-box protein 21